MIYTKPLLRKSNDISNLLCETGSSANTAWTGCTHGDAATGCTDGNSETSGSPNKCLNGSDNPWVCTVGNSASFPVPYCNTGITPET